MRTSRFAEIIDRLARLEDRVDAIHFQLFEERLHRSGAERHFDDRRRDRDYDVAYRNAWRALYPAEEADGPESSLPGP